MSTNESTNLHEGKVVFRSGAYGFIQLNKGESIFFHKTDIANPIDVHKIKVFYDVSFEKSLSVQPKHTGKPCATNVNIIKKNKIYAKDKKGFKDIDLYLGIISKMDYTYTSGYVKSPQFEKEIKFFQTRNIFKKKFFNIGDVIVINPVKSSENNYDIFAFIAYHADCERSIDFLKAQALESRDPIIKAYVAERILKAKPIIALDQEFEAKLLVIDFNADESNSYQTLKKLIEEYKAKSFFPGFTLLKKYCPDEFLIKLFLDAIIDQYDPDLLYHYFKGTYADTKRHIIQRLFEEDRIVFLNKYYSELREKNLLRRLTNFTKLLLDITYRSEATRCKNLYLEIKNYLIEHLNPNELIELWVNNYIDSLSESFWKVNFDENEPILTNILLKYKNEKIARLLERKLESYLYQTHNLISNFDKEHPSYIRRLLIYKNILKKSIDELIKLLKIKLNDLQIVTFWVFGVDLTITLQEALYHSSKLNDYYRVRFLLRYKKLATLEDWNSITKNSITQAGLIHFIETYEWNQLVQPVLPGSSKPTETETSIQFSFIDDINVFANLNIANGLDANKLAISLFHSMVYYSVYHIRLWLYGFVEEDFLDYMGFRNAFKELKRDEQYKFRLMANKIIHNQKIYQIEIEEVKPCLTFVSESKNTCIYESYLENIYFSYGEIKLRKHDKEYTKTLSLEGVSPGFNRIPSDDSLNKMPIFINVDLKHNEIINVSGLDDIITKIYTDEIRKALGTVIDDNVGMSGRQAYAEDWELRKSILNYLEENHSKRFDKQTIKEPRNFFRRLDAHSGIDNYNLTRLYTIDMPVGYAIIWENIDLSFDKATYVFRATDTDYEPKIKNIIEGISALAQFKSTLSNQRDSQEELSIFRRKYGFLGSVRKKRGDNLAFKKWRGQLEEIANSPIPSYPSQKELEKLKNWKPNNNHSTRVGGLPPIKTINEGSVKTDDTGIPPEGNTKPPSNAIKTDMESLLDKLKNFNSSFLEGINI